MTEAPTGTVTFLFTDLERSTRLWDEEAETMRDALKRHDELLQDSVEANGGYRVKTTGDGVHAAFATAIAGVAAAVAAQRAVIGEPWPSDPLRVRMAVHTGSAEFRDGDYYGPALNRAARLMAAAHGGQIVISNATEELVRDELPSSMTVEDLGEHRLRDLRRPERVFQVNAPDLPISFPPLRTLDSYPGNLPRQRTAFVGRTKELAELPELLERATTVTLTGPGGVGKTRLALQIAAETITRFPDGAWFVDLGPTVDASLVPSAVGAALRVREPRLGTFEDALIAAIGSQAMLIVLDNCEHVVDAAAHLIEQLVEHCSNLAMLMTSREALGVEGEHVVPVVPLPLPTEGESRNAEDALANDAVRLFVDRAQATRHGFTLSPEHAGPVCELARRLDGIPLAIELAAARVGSMSPSDLVARLDERFRLLAHGRRTALSRHQTLRGAIDWSYALLEPLERLVFARLSVFAGRFTLEAAEAVVTDDHVQSEDVLDVLANLVGKSMVVADEREGSTRYSVLETLREYGRERLVESSEVDEFGARHAAHYLELAETAAPHLKGPDDAEWAVRIEQDLDNLRAALAWAQDADRETSTRLLAALWMYWYQGRAQEGREWMELLASASRDRGEVLEPELEAMVGLLSVAVGHAETEPLLRRAIARAEAAGTTPHPELLTQLGIVRLEHNDVEAALGYAMRGLDVAREHNDSYQIAHALCGLTTVCSLAGDERRARELADEVLARAEELGNAFVIAHAQLVSGIVRCVSDPATAVEQLGASTAWRRDPNFAIHHLFTGIAHLRLGEFEKAATDLDRALTLFPVLGNEYYVRMTAQVVPGLLLAVGFVDPAIQLLSATEHIRNRAHVVGTPRELDAQERIRQRLERMTDSERFSAAWGEGQSMTLDEAVAFARDQLARFRLQTSDDSPRPRRVRPSEQ